MFGIHSSGSVLKSLPSFKNNGHSDWWSTFSASYGAVLFRCEGVAAAVFTTPPSFVLDRSMSLKILAWFLNMFRFLWFDVAEKLNLTNRQAAFIQRYVTWFVLFHWVKKDAAPVFWDKAKSPVHVGCWWCEWGTSGGGGGRVRGEFGGICWSQQCTRLSFSCNDQIKLYWTISVNPSLPKENTHNEWHRMMISTLLGPEHMYDYNHMKTNGRHSQIKKALLDLDIGGFFESVNGVKFKNWCFSHVARSSSKTFLCKVKPHPSHLKCSDVQMAHTGKPVTCQITSLLSLIAASVKFLLSLSKIFLCSSRVFHSSPRRSFSCSM